MTLIIMEINYKVHFIVYWNLPQDILLVFIWI